MNANRPVWWLLTPALAFLTAFFVAPVLALLASAAGAPLGLGPLVAFFADDLNREIYWRTVRVAITVTALAAIVGYPAAMAAVALPPRWRGLVTALIVLPLMTSPVARTYAWIIILGRTGIVNDALVALGALREPARLLFTEGAVIVGLLQLLLPLMLLSLTSALENLPRDAVPAARSLGATGWQAFTRVVFPLTREGLAVGGTLVFTGCVTAYVTPALLGGPRVSMLPTLLYQKASVVVDERAASVIALVMLITALLASAVLRGSSRRRKAPEPAGERELVRAAT